jgi:starch-binding outer membrane protein, SusD/RagB family
MKKIILLYLLLIITTGIFHSCESFLEEKPVDRYVVDNFYNDQSAAEAAVSAVYQQLYSIYERYMFLLNEQPADDNRSGIQPNQYLQDLEYLRHSSENQFTRQMWQYNYSGIARANTAIENIPEIDMDETVKNRLLGEVKFLRALYYFNLVRFWGDVPLVLKVGIEESMGPRVPKDQVYQQIITDLSDAENNLPVSYPATETCRATKGAAKILLGKVYLTMHDYQSCVSKLAEVIENEASYGYGLHEYFGDNWEKETENGKEMVFSVEFMDPPGNGNSMMVLQGPKYALPHGFAPLGLSNCNEADTPTMDLYLRFSDEDERKDETFRINWISLIDGSIHKAIRPIYCKYHEEDEPITANSDCNMHVVRYADALLMYAEALNEVDQNTKAHDYLNRVRERAFNSTEHNYSGLSKQEFREAVWLERRLELSMEGHRWFDLVRTERFVERMTEFAEFESQYEPDKIKIKQNVRDYHELMPIPQIEIDLNPNITQNPGY